MIRGKSAPNILESLYVMICDKFHVTKVNLYIWFVIPFGSLTYIHI